MYVSNFYVILLHVLGLAASYNQHLTVNGDSGFNNGSCSSGSPCKDLSYAIKYMNNNQENTNIKTISMESDTSNESIQLWDVTLIINSSANSNGNGSFATNCSISGEGQDITTVLWDPSSISSGLYYRQQNGIQMEFSNFKFSLNGDNNDEVFIYSYYSNYDGQFLFKNVKFENFALKDYFIYDQSRWGDDYGHNLMLFQDCVISNVTSSVSLVDQGYSGGISMENVIWKNNNIADYVFWSNGRRDVFDDSGARYLKNIQFENNQHSQLFVFDYNPTGSSDWRFENLHFVNDFHGSGFVRLRAPYSESVFYGENITISESSTIDVGLFYIEEY